MKKVVTHLDDDLYTAFVSALDDIPIAKGLRRLVRDFVAKKQEGEAKK